MTAADVGTTIRLQQIAPTLEGGSSQPALSAATATVLSAAPTCLDAAAATPAGGGTTAVILACSSPVGEALTYVIDTPPAHGSLGSVDPATGAVTYTSAPGFTGTDRFTYHATGLSGTAAPATATVTVPAAPGPFVAPTLTVTCSPGILTAQQTAACTVIASDASGPSGGIPTGSIIFTSPTGSFGGGGTCRLAGRGSTAICAVSFTATAAGTVTINASYAGDATHAGARASTTVASPPVAGQSAAVTASGGVVLIKEGDRFVALGDSTISVPVGSTIDARKGVVTVTTAADGLGAANPRHRLQTGTFSAGIFAIKQQAQRRRDQTPPTDVLLKTAPHAVAHALCTRTDPPTKGIVRMLHGVVKGVYRVIGGARTATLTRGTFTVQDRCDGTLTRLTHGHATITVTRGAHRTLHLSAGQSYLAKVRLFAAKQKAARGVAFAVRDVVSVLRGRRAALLS